MPLTRPGRKPAVPPAATLAPASARDAGARPGGGQAVRFLQQGGEMGARMRALDWSATPLGPPAGWPQSLKTMIRVMLDSRYAMWMLWGPQKTFFCNDAYLPTVGIKKDWVLGERADKVWAEIWPDIGPRIEQVLAHGQATWDESLLLFLERSGFPEETYHTFSYSPAYDDHSRIAGMLCVVTEVSERVIGERRLCALRDLAARRAGIESVPDCCKRLSQVLASDPFDMPFTALYLLSADRGQAQRVAQSGELHDALPLTLSVTRESKGDAQPWPLQALLRAEAPQLVPSLPALGIELSAGVWPDTVQQALLLPVKGAGSGLAGFLIVGCSPRRLLDERYRSCLGLAAGQIGSAIADAQAFDAERLRAEALAELDRAKTAFFSNVSHEFRTPLTLMLGPLEEVLDSDELAPRERERLLLAQRAAVRLQRLVNSLLDFARIEAGRVAASYEPTDLAAFTRDLASSFRSAMDKAGLHYRVECGGLAAPAYVDREMWEKIVLNLLSNAFKFTLAGSVCLRLTQEGASALLEVADTGAGIPAEELPRLFERFHRVEGTEARTHEGSGIGLALVHELVKLHGGSIEASSVLRQGTSLKVRIPLGADHLPAGHIKPARGMATEMSGTRSLVAHSIVDEALHWLPEAAQGAAQDGADGGAPGLAPTRLHGADGPAVADRRFAAVFGSRVLLADDNADMRSYIRELLAPFYVVQAVADGRQALAAARGERPDLIVCDVMMPRLDGLGLLQAVRADPALRTVPVVLLSARAGQEALIEGLDAGADDYVVKPFSSRELLARLGALLELRRIRQASEEAFRRRTAQYETLLEEAPLGVFLVDADLLIREANPIARATFGDLPDLLGRDFTELIRRLWAEPYAGDLVRRFRHTLETGEPFVSPEHVERRLDRGVVEFYESQIHRIPLPDGRFGVVCYFRDISVHILARNRLEAADRQKDEFLAMLAHELRNPLAPIRYAGEILTRSLPADDRARQAAGIVQRQVANLSRLVDDLLDVSRITQGRVELQQQSVALAEVAAQAVETVEPLMREKDHRLSVVAQRALRVHGDPARLVQCVANLLNNAAKYTDRGGSIELEIGEEAGQALIVVSDNGIGISAELQPTVFDLFVQGDRTLDRAQGGLGVGLSVVKRLIEMHGGRVLVRSAGRGQGSRFEIRLPLIQAAQPCAGGPAAPEVTPLRVLVVDDNIDAAESLSMVLSLDGHQVACAYTAADALNRAIAVRPEVALLDIGIPGMDGYELARRLRGLPGLAQVRLIALTGYGMPEDRSRALAAGFDAHLVKPPVHGQLLKALAGG